MKSYQIGPRILLLRIKRIKRSLILISGLRRIHDLERNFLAPRGHKGVTCLGSINEKSEILSEEEILIDLLAGDDLTPRVPRGANFGTLQGRLKTPYTCRAALKNRNLDDLEQSSVGELSFNSSSDDSASVIMASPCSRLPGSRLRYGIHKDYYSI